MAITDYKITDGEREQVRVVGQPTVLQKSPAENKAVFDAFAEMIADHFNNALDEIASDTSAEIDRQVLDLYIALGWTPENS